MYPRHFVNSTLRKFSGLLVQKKANIYTRICQTDETVLIDRFTCFAANKNSVNLSPLTKQWIFISCSTMALLSSVINGRCPSCFILLLWLQKLYNTRSFPFFDYATKFFSFLLKRRGVLFFCPSTKLINPADTSGIRRVHWTIFICTVLRVKIM